MSKIEEVVGTGPRWSLVLKGMLNVVGVLVIIAMFYCYANYKVKSIRHEEVNTYIYKTGTSYIATVQDPTEEIFIGSGISHVSESDAIVKASENFDNEIFYTFLIGIGLLVVVFASCALIEKITKRHLQT